jgi:hypothetical protein
VVDITLKLTDVPETCEKCSPITATSVTPGVATVGLIDTTGKPVKVNVADAVLEATEESTATTNLDKGNVDPADEKLEGTTKVAEKVPLLVITLDTTIESSNLTSTVVPAVTEKPLPDTVTTVPDEPLLGERTTTAPPCATTKLETDTVDTNKNIIDINTKRQTFTLHLNTFIY